MTGKAFVFWAVMLAASPAAAQMWGPNGPGGYPAATSPDEINASLRASGFRPVTQPVYSGHYVVVRAIDGRGEFVRVLLNARFGNIVAVTPLPPAPIGSERYEPSARPGFVDPYRRYGAVRPDLGVEPSVPNSPNGANAPQRHPGTRSSQPPMPRPRPAVPASTAEAKPSAETRPSPTASEPIQPPPSPSAAPSAATAGEPAPSGGSAFPPAAPLE